MINILIASRTRGYGAERASQDVDDGLQLREVARREAKRRKQRYLIHLEEGVDVGNAVDIPFAVSTSPFQGSLGRCPAVPVGSQLKRVATERYQIRYLEGPGVVWHPM